MDIDSHSGHLVGGIRQFRPMGKAAAPKPQSGTGQGNGEAHIRFSSPKAEERTPLSLRTGVSKDPTPAFDEFGNPIYRGEDESSGAMPLV